MSGKILFQALALFMLCGTSCVDSKYDLSDVDTDDLVVGDEWVAPLGTGSISVDDVIKVYKVPAIKMDADGSYVARYEGKFTALKSGLRAGEDYEKIALAQVSMKDLQGLFDEDFVLSLADPHLMFTSGFTTGSLDCRLDINGNKAVSNSFFTLSGTTPDIWIGPEASSVKPGYFFCKDTDLPKVIAEVPANIDLNLWGKTDQLGQLPAGSLSNLGYTVEIPLTPALDFKAITVERVKDAFDETFVDYIFSGGTAKIYGTVTNEMPFDLAIEMIILDELGKPLDITFPLQKVAGNSGSVEFVFTEAMMAKMTTARNLDFKLHLTGRAKPENLKKGQEISLSLKLQKTGGISL